ncbi:MAG: ribbon-helix-helix protein, CopG family [Alphaproteobacteria bacterium]|nr:ribbon-helix-helix protein, CopG family [Alphaproteobacteria bacterium]
MSKTLTVRLDEEVIEKLKEMAKVNLRTISKTIEFLVREHLAKEESFDEYFKREKPYIDHALGQKAVSLKFEDVFHD